jgi:hypothetical protein
MLRDAQYATGGMLVAVPGTDVDRDDEVLWPRDRCRER